MGQGSRKFLLATSGRPVTIAVMTAFDRSFDVCALISTMVSAIVVRSDQVKVIPIASSDERITIIHVIVPKGEDKGRLIGRGGRTAHSLRVILQAVTRQHNIALRLEIIDEFEAQSLASLSDSSLGFKISTSYAYIRDVEK